MENTILNIEKKTNDSTGDMVTQFQTLSFHWKLFFSYPLHAIPIQMREQGEFLH